jgi:hypothetical protein
MLRIQFLAYQYLSGVLITTQISLELGSETWSLGVNECYSVCVMCVCEFLAANPVRVHFFTDSQARVKAKSSGI